MTSWISTSFAWFVVVHLVESVVWGDEEWHFIAGRSSFPFWAECKSTRNAPCTPSSRPMIGWSVTETALPSIFKLSRDSQKYTLFFFTNLLKLGSIWYKSNHIHWMCVPATTIYSKCEFGTLWKEYFYVHEFGGFQGTKELLNNRAG